MSTESQMRRERFHRDLDDLLVRHSDLCQEHPTEIIGVLINLADGYRDALNVDYEIETINDGGQVMILLEDGDTQMAGCFGFERDDAGGIVNPPDSVSYEGSDFDAVWKEVAEQKLFEYPDLAQAVAEEDDARALNRLIELVQTMTSDEIDPADVSQFIQEHADEVGNDA